MNDRLRETLLEIVHRFFPDNVLHRAWELTGGISAQTIALELGQSNGALKKLILKQHGIADHKRNPNIASDEYRLLQKLHVSGLPVPEPYFLDSSCELLTLPYIVLEFIESDHSLSQTTTQNLIHSFAGTLAMIHALDLTQHDLSFLPHQDTYIQTQLNTVPSGRDTLIDTLKKVFPNIDINSDTLLHGDYWTGNILWRNRQLAGVIDWEDAMLGDPLGDLGKSRLEMLWAYGVNFMNAYTTVYLAKMPAVDMTYLPFWDLWGAYRLADFETWFDDAVKVKEMKEKYTLFVNDAIHRLPV